MNQRVYMRAIAALLITVNAAAYDKHQSKHLQDSDDEIRPLVEDPTPRNIRLRSHMGFDQVATDIWGYTATDGREYACMGLAPMTILPIVTTCVCTRGFSKTCVQWNI